jgi:hypothetical protein
MIGYTYGKKAYTLFDLDARKVFSSRHVVFDETGSISVSLRPVDTVTSWTYNDLLRHLVTSSSDDEDDDIIVISDTPQSPSVESVGDASLLENSAETVGDFAPSISTAANGSVPTPRSTSQVPDVTPTLSTAGNSSAPKSSTLSEIPKRTSKTKPGAAPVSAPELEVPRRSSRPHQPTKDKNADYYRAEAKHPMNPATQPRPAGKTVVRTAAAEKDARKRAYLDTA